jgi:hypothetical protein
MNFYKIKLFIIRITPPFLLDFIIYFINNLKKDKNESKYIEKNISDNLDFNQIYYSTNNAVYNVPIQNIRHHGGQAYNYIQHHFMQYYKYGIESLDNYYIRHNPVSVFEKHFILNEDSKQISLPWSNTNQAKIEGEHGIGSENGHSAYGPVSQKKLKLEAKRLDYCLRSIKKSGYLVKDKYTRIYNGFPRGYFLVSNNGDWVFRIVGAKHRVAALAHLGWKNIPVSIQPHFPHCIFERDISNWPRVISGEFKETEAKLIFEAYFRDESLELWH